MKRIIFNTLLLLAFASLAFGQRKTQKTQPPPKMKCTLTVDRAPELRGFLLNMTQERLLARFPGITIDPADDFGVVKLRFNVLDAVDYRQVSSGRDKGIQSTAPDPLEGRLFTIDNSRFPDLKGVRKIQLRLLDGRLVYILIGYDDSVKWDSTDVFVQTIAKTLGLPVEWLNGPDREERRLPCNGFLVSAALAGDFADSRLGPQLSLEDTSATHLVEKREKDLEEKNKRQEEDRRKTFKP